MSGKGFHQKLNAEEALLSYILLKGMEYKISENGFDVSTSKVDYQPVLDIVNETFPTKTSSRKEPVSALDLCSLIKHITRQELTMLDFLPNPLYRSYEKAYQ